MKDSLGLKLQELRKKKNLSQAEVAALLHVSRQAVSNWELGKTQPDVESIKLLCKLYGVTVGEMLGEEKKQGQELEDNKKRNEKYERQWILETLVIAIVLALASQVAILGVVVSIAIIIWICATKKSLKMKILILFLCLIALTISAQYTYVFLSYYFAPEEGTAVIQQVYIRY